MSMSLGVLVVVTLYQWFTEDSPAWMLGFMAATVAWLRVLMLGGLTG